jgi:hypothetical protein
MDLNMLHVFTRALVLLDMTSEVLQAADFQCILPPLIANAPSVNQAFIWVGNQRAVPQLPIGDIFWEGVIVKAWNDWSIGYVLHPCRSLPLS